MDRLSEVIIFTGDLAGMKRYYESLGLAILQDSPQWVAFDTAGATLGLRPVTDPAEAGIELRFATAELDARVAGLGARGVTLAPPGIARYPWGRFASLQDPEGRRLTFWEPAQPSPHGSGLPLSVVLNCRDLGALKSYYRDTLGFTTGVDTPWWVQLEVGAATLGLHPHVERTAVERHHAGGVTVGLGVPDLLAWYEEANGRGVAFRTPPTDRGFGVFADSMDPDGHEVSIRELPEAESLEEQLAEPFEDDATPRQAAFRKPVKKRATAASRLTLKPVHKGKRTPGARRHPAKAARVVSPRGTGPAGARQKPKVGRDPKRARTKPAIGRLRKAERRALTSQKQAVASASKSKPVKRAATSARKATPAKRTSRARPAKRAERRTRAKR